MRRNSGSLFFEGLGIAVTAIAGTIGVLFIGLLGLSLKVFFGWLAGHILVFFAGAFIVNALTAFLAMFGIAATITTATIPLVTASLAFFGHFFKSTVTNNNHKN